MDYLPQFGQNVDTQDVSGIPTDDATAQLMLKRRLAQADLLKGTEMPQGQMVSGHYVAPSWTQYLANAVGKYQGGQQEKQAMQGYQEYQTGKQKKLAAALDTLNEDTKPKPITEQSSYQIQVPNGQMPQTENIGGMQPYQSGIKTIDVPMSKITGYEPRTAAERDAAMYKFAVATQNPELMSKVAFNRIDKMDAADVLKAQHEYDYLIHKRDRGEKLTDTENANLFALNKLAQEQQFTAKQNALQRGVTMRGQDMTAANQPLVAVLDTNGNPTYVPRNQAVGKTPYNVNKPAMTEDQAKATGWLNQATNAYQNMKNVMYKKDPKTGQVIVDAQGRPAINYDVVQPSTKEVLATASGVEGLGQSSSRQQFNQAASSLSESLLRAATGAGVNESEAKQKIRELTPTYFDKPEVIQQKLDSIPNYLKSLEQRSGRSLTPTAKTVVRTGTDKASGRKVVQYSDGTTAYAE